MRAILIATGGRDGSAPVLERYPDPLLPLLDRPFLQHVIESLARQGVRKFDFILCHKPEAVEQYFGDGTRWGCEFIYHLVRNPARPYRVVKALAQGEDDLVLFGHADRLPAFDLNEIVAAARGGILPLFVANADGKKEWTGWALLPPASLPSIRGGWDETTVRCFLQARSAGFTLNGSSLAVTSGAELLAAQRAVLDKQFGPLFLTGREIEPGVWLSRNVMLHPSAKLTAPVFVGEDCRIGPGVHLGPHAVVGRGCILDRDCTVARSLVFPENYVGPNLELDDVIVDRNRILSSEGMEMTADSVILGSLTPGRRGGRQLAAVAARLLALCFLVLASPILLAVALFLKCTRPGPLFFGMEVVRIPSPPAGRRSTCTLWSFLPDGVAAAARGDLPLSARTLLLVHLPALVNIVRGNMSFVGVPPRTLQAVDQLSPEWRSLYLCCKVGLIAEAALRAGEPTNETERYAAEAYYAAAGDWRYDLRLLFGFARQMLLGVPVARDCPTM